ncbi:hypothetical protein M408DRAFT_329911 [Serendipita vermifera MAFF 305830]|uniref:Uncharacterized protein n=1 Tax=Serendipita vermifera MAFF 305830 TaxID=933852 RepID=A0A0C3B8G7_SERVB|nr:hypothetical protein M408DRAFT_329911 [Serendipita vermifera MAFF 305830]
MKFADFSGKWMLQKIEKMVPGGRCSKGRGGKSWARQQMTVKNFLGGFSGNLVVVWVGRGWRFSQ